MGSNLTLFIRSDEMEISSDALSQEDKQKKFLNFLQKNLPGVIKCPITGCIYGIPVIASDGFLYEQVALEQLFKAGIKKSPITREAISEKYGHVPMFDNILKFVEENGIDIGYDKFIIDPTNFEENMEIVCSLVKNMNIKGIKQFKKFVLEYSDHDGIIFCTHLFRNSNAENKYYKCVKYILEHSTNLYFNYKGITLLHVMFKYCINGKLLKFAIELLKKDGNSVAKLNIEDSNKKLPIYYAFMNNINMIPTILDLGFIEYCTPDMVNLTIQNGMTNNILSLFKVIKPDFDKNISHLVMAIKCKKIDIINHILNICPNIDTPYNGKLPIHYACMTGRLDIAKIFIDRSTNLEVEDNDGWRPIHFVCYYGNSDLIDYILTKNVVLTKQVLSVGGNKGDYFPINLVETSQILGKNGRQKAIEKIIEVMQLQLE